MGTLAKGYSFGVEDNVGPVAIITPANQESVVGAVVKMDGRASFDTDGQPSGVITYQWSFSRVPIGSQVELTGFEPMDPDSTVVTFAPDVTGFYEVSLVVNDGSIDSDPTLGSVDVSVISVPNNRGITPDASFVWNYLSDFWNMVDDKERFEVLWAAAIQIIGAELLKLYQYDYNKSIRDIQSVFQRRWIHYDPELVFVQPSEATAILTDNQAGLNAATLAIDPDSGVVLDDQENFFNLVTVPLTEGAFRLTSYNKVIPPGLLISVADRSYTLARSNRTTKAINEGDDGSINVASPDTFNGSGFYDTYVGLVLKILSGSDVGDYLVATVSVDGNSVTVTDMDGGAVTFTTTASGLDYTVVPTSPNLSSFFADQKVIPTRTSGQEWRFGATFQTDEYELEEYGVSIGDVLVVNVHRVGLDLAYEVGFQIIGVDRDRVSFVFNTDDLTDGVPAGGLSDDTQLALAEALQITGLSRNSAGVLEYSLEAATIRSKLISDAFKREYYETTLTWDTEIDLGAFIAKLTPIKIVRNSKMLLPSDILSIPMMQEYIKQPELGEVDGQLYIIGKNGLLHEIDHEPYILTENLDYVIDDQSEVTGYADTVQGSEEVYIPRGDLIDRGIKRGDSLELVIGGTEVIFDIKKVLDSETLVVYPSPSSTGSVQFTIVRRVAGKFLRFVNGTFSKDNPIPSRMWAELTFMDNNPLIEANFGSLVGVRAEDIPPAQAPYKSIVEGLMYALANGPVVNNLHLAAQILLGLPFAEEQGVVTEINPEFRLRNDGSPLYGRILIEARDNDGNSTGSTNVYLYPLGRQLEDPDTPDGWIPATPNEAGLAINPDTGVEYAVGDSVTQFAALSKGVEIADYISDDTLTDSMLEQGIISALVTQYQSFRLRINSDITTPSDVNLTTSFIKTAKPHYANISAGLLKIIEDIIDIEDSVIFGLITEMFDTIGYSLPVAVKVDPGTVDDDYLSIDGIMYTRYVLSHDLITTQGSNHVTSASGGFVSPGANQTFDRPLVRAGDILDIEAGFNAGKYPIASVVDDNGVIVTFTGQFETAGSQTFRIYRPVVNPIFPQFSATVASTSQIVDIDEGGMSAGVAVGDVFTFHGGAVDASRIYTIIAFDRGLKQITVTPAVVEAGGTYTGNIRREGIETQYLGNDESDTPFTAAFATGSAAVVFDPGSSDLDQLSFVRPEDTIILGSFVFNILDFDPSTLTAYVDPKPTFTSASESVAIWRPSRQGTPIGFAFTERIPDECVDLELQRTTGPLLAPPPSPPYVGGVDPADYLNGVLLADLQTTATSPDVDSATGEDFDALGIVPGDLLVLLDGTDSVVDIGYGTGVYPIQELPDVNTLRLTRPLTATGTFKYGIRRRKSL